MPLGVCVRESQVQISSVNEIGVPHFFCEGSFFRVGARLETGLVQEPHCAAQLSEFSLVLVGRCIVLGFLGIHRVGATERGYLGNVQLASAICSCR